MDPAFFKLGILWYLIFLASIVLHEFAHALAAYKLGDDTAFRVGQVSLNPVPHIRREVFGTVIVPIVSYFLGGWMIGWASTPFDVKWAKENIKKSALMSLAGPAANLALFLLAFLLIRVGYALDIFYPPDAVNFSRITEATIPGVFEAVSTILSVMLSLNLLLLIFNLLPLPVFDGSNLILLFINERHAPKVFDTIHNPRYMFFSIFVAWNLFDYLFSPTHLFVINLIYPGIVYG